MAPKLTAQEIEKRCLKKHGGRFSFELPDFSLGVNKPNKFRCKEHDQVILNTIATFLKTKIPCFKCQPNYENEILEKRGKKRCNQCKIIKTFDEFHIQRKKLRPNCVSCRSQKTDETKQIDKMLSQGQKRCHQCKQFKPFDEFNLNRLNPLHGRQSKCRECQRAYNSPPRALAKKLFEKGLQTCTTCDQTLPISDYHKAKWAHLGINTVCKACSNQKTKVWRSENKEKNAELQKRYRLANPDKGRERVRRRQAAKLQATPSWLSETHISEMVLFYTEARQKTVETGVKHEVDHIIPLISDVVSGLHVPWNLQILTTFENRSKSNNVDLQWDLELDLARNWDVDLDWTPLSN